MFYYFIWFSFVLFHFISFFHFLSFRLIPFIRLFLVSVYYQNIFQCLLGMTLIQKNFPKNTHSCWSLCVSVSGNNQSVHAVLLSLLFSVSVSPLVSIYIRLSQHARSSFAPLTPPLLPWQPQSGDLAWSRSHSRILRDSSHSETSLATRYRLMISHAEMKVLWRSVMVFHI